jgi:hypothetical protein
MHRGAQRVPGRRRSPRPRVHHSVAAGFPAVEAAFNAFVAKHADAQWALGNVYDPADEATPLNWW